jgi:alpha-tubulin suppressor-like RCC1 family protein
MLGLSGSLQCWGTNNFFVIGSMNVGNQVQTPTPSDYPEILKLNDKATIALFDGRSSHELVVDQAGGLWAWGDNTFGQLGTQPTFSPSPCYGGGTGGYCVSVPVGVDIADGGSVSAIATGVGFSLALTSDGTVWAWGANTEGQLGYMSDGKPCVKLDAGAEPCNWVPSPIQVPP